VALALISIVCLAVLVPNGLAILAGALAIFLGLFIFIFFMHQMVVEGHTFHLFNYYLPIVKYGLASQLKGEPGVKEFWKSLEGDRPYVAEGLGPVTETLFGHREIWAALSTWGDDIRNGTMRRANELGLALMSSAAFSEPVCPVVLPVEAEDHALVRPYLAKTCDGSRRPETVQCPAGLYGGWNRASLRQAWRDRFNSVDTFNSGDTLWWYNIMLHKVMLNWEMTDEEAQAYMGPGPGTAKLGVGLANITERELCLFKFCTPVPCFKAKMAEHADGIKECLMENYPYEEWDDDKLAHVSNFFQTGLLWAGGLSVPTIIQNMLAHWYSTENRPSDLQRVSATDEDSIKDFMWEAMRRNPPVAGVPRWVIEEDGSNWHQVANVEQAMGDEREFPDPLTFKMGRPGLNSQDNSKSLFFADAAIVNNDTCHPDSHLCPGKNLALESIIAFWQEFLLDNWSTDNPNVSVGYNLTTQMDLYRD
jgi:hypothetical protein